MLEPDAEVSSNPDGSTVNVEDELSRVEFSLDGSGAWRLWDGSPRYLRGDLDETDSGISPPCSTTCKLSELGWRDAKSVSEMSELLAQDQKKMRTLQEDFGRSQLRQLQRHEQLMQRFLLEHSTRVEKALEGNPFHHPSDGAVSVLGEPRKSVRISCGPPRRGSDLSVASPTSGGSAGALGMAITKLPPPRRRFPSQGTWGSTGHELNAEMQKRSTEVQYGNLVQIRESASLGMFRSVLSATGSGSLVSGVSHTSGCAYLTCGPLFRFVNSYYFALMVAFLITVNAVVIGISTDVEVKAAFERRNGTGSSPSEHRWLPYFDAACTVIFAFELVLRIVASQPMFCFSPEWQWNLFDVAIVATALLELFLARYSLDLKYMRVLRLARVVRTLRVARLIPLFAKLRALINALISSIASLLWAMGVLIFLIFLFAIIFLQGATQYIDDEDALADHVQFPETFFASMGMTLLSLFMCVTSGLNWWEVEAVLLEIHPVYGFLFVLYIATMVLSLLNIVTGICVNNALEMANLDHDLMTKVELERKAAYIERLEGLFHDLDVDDSGTLSFEEFVGHLDRQEVTALFSVLGIEVSDAISFFEALDVDGSHELEIDEFVMGCLNLRGNVRTVDVATLLRENKRLMRRIGKVAKKTDTQLQEIIDRLPVDNSSKGQYFHNNSARTSGAARPSTIDGSEERSVEVL